MKKIRAAIAAYRKTEPGKILMAQYRKKYANTDLGRAAGRRRYYSTRARNLLKSKARQAINHAVFNGTIAKPDTCSRCCGGGIIHGHHHKGYEPEFWLDVEWICAPCHRDAHRMSDSKPGFIL